MRHDFFKFIPSFSDDCLVRSVSGGGGGRMERSGAGASPLSFSLLLAFAVRLFRETIGTVALRAGA